MIYKIAIGEDSHRFSNENKPLILGGIIIHNHQGLLANSDGDVVIHAIINAISGITTHNILGGIADVMCGEGITDSTKYLQIATQDLIKAKYNITHLSISIKCLKPKISSYTDTMRQNIAKLLNVSTAQIGITATTDEGLSDFGKGLGIYTTAVITVCKNG